LELVPLLNFILIFSPSFLEMREFSLSYQILLSLFDILNVFYDYILVNIEAKMCQTV